MTKNVWNWPRHATIEEHNYFLSLPALTPGELRLWLALRQITRIKLAEEIGISERTIRR